MYVVIYYSHFYLKEVWLCTEHCHRITNSKSICKSDIHIPFDSIVIKRQK